MKYPNSNKTYQHTATKNTSRRGMSLENDINQSCLYYLDEGLCNIHKKPTPVTIVNVDFKGYSASEVDAFLDIILEDYQIYEENLDELKSEIQKLHEEVAELKKHNLELEGKQRVIDLSNTTSYSSVDLLKRVARLEEEVYKK